MWRWKSICVTLLLIRMPLVVRISAPLLMLTGDVSVPVSVSVAVAVWLQVLEEIQNLENMIAESDVADAPGGNSQTSFFLQNY